MSQTAEKVYRLLPDKKVFRHLPFTKSMIYHKLHVSQSANKLNFSNRTAENYTNRSYRRSINLRYGKKHQITCVIGFVMEHHCYECT